MKQWNEMISWLSPNGIFNRSLMRRRTLSWGADKLVLIAPLNCWRNSTPFWCKASLCTIKIDDFRTLSIGINLANNDKPKNDDDVDNNAHWFLLFSGIKRDFLFDPNRDVYSTNGTGHWGTTILEHCPLGPISLIMINQKMMMMLITQCSLVPAFFRNKKRFSFWSKKGCI